MNDSANNTNVTGSTETIYTCLFSPMFTGFSLTVTAVVIIWTCFGNTLILLSLFKFPTVFKGCFYHLIGNLAVCDLLLGFALFLYPIEYIVPEVTHSFVFCSLRICTIVFTLACTYGTLICISVDRYMAVTKPMKHLVKTTRSRACYGIVSAIWILSAVGSFALLFTHIRKSYNRSDEDFICRASALLPRDAQIIFATCLLLELIIHIVLYVILTCEIRKQAEAFPRHNSKKGTKTTMMVVVFIVFAICWIPFSITALLIATSKDIKSRPAYLCFSEYLALFGYCNSGMNWIIYGLMNKKFKAAFIAILKCQKLHTNASGS